MRGEAERITPNYNYPKLQLPKLQLPQIYNYVCVIISWLVRLHGRSSTGGPAGRAGDVRKGRSSGGPLGAVRAVRRAVRPGCPAVRAVRVRAACDIQDACNTFQVPLVPDVPGT